MKIKKLHSDNADMKDLKENWSDKIVEYMEEEQIKVPFMTGLPKGEQKSQIHFIGMSRVASMVEILRDDTPRFKTLSEVHRAAHYLGVMLMYKFYRSELIKNDCNDSFYQSCLELEQPLNDMMTLDYFTATAEQVHNLFKRGLFDNAMMRDRIDKLIDALPKRLQKLAKGKFDALLHGEVVTDLYETESWGGKR